MASEANLLVWQQSLELGAVIVIGSCFAYGHEDQGREGRATDRIIGFSVWESTSLMEFGERLVFEHCLDNPLTSI